MKVNIKCFKWVKVDINVLFLAGLVRVDTNRPIEKVDSGGNISIIGVLNLELNSDSSDNIINVVIFDFDFVMNFIVVIIIVIRWVDHLLLLVLLLKEKCYIIDTDRVNSINIK